MSAPSSSFLVVILETDLHRKDPTASNWILRSLSHMRPHYEAAVHDGMDRGPLHPVVNQPPASGV